MGKGVKIAIPVSIAQRISRLRQFPKEVAEDFSESGFKDERRERIPK